jgi:hypothetical protein
VSRRDTGVVLASRSFGKHTRFICTANARAAQGASSTETAIDRRVIGGGHLFRLASLFLTSWGIDVHRVYILLVIAVIVGVLLGGRKVVAVKFGHDNIFHLISFQFKAFSNFNVSRLNDWNVFSRALALY